MSDEQFLKQSLESPTKIRFFKITIHNMYIYSYIHTHSIIIDYFYTTCFVLPFFWDVMCEICYTLGCPTL